MRMTYNVTALKYTFKYLRFIIPILFLIGCSSSVEYRSVNGDVVVKSGTYLMYDGHNKYPHILEIYDDSTLTYTRPSNLRWTGELRWYSDGDLGIQTFGRPRFQMSIRTSDKEGFFENDHPKKKWIRK